MMNTNLTMLADFYEFTMANGYFENGLKDKIACFDMFFRKVPDNGGFAIATGLQQLIDYLQSLSFSDTDIEYLRSRKLFSEEFLDYLKNFEFSCDVYAMREGSPCFPREPLIIIRGPLVQAQLVETMVLLTMNHQSLIATKANRIVRAAQGRTVMEFGSRRAQGADAAIAGSRAAYIGGCAGSACTISDVLYQIPALGTMAHSWVQTFDSEYEAFSTYAKTYPKGCTLLIDTYNVLKSGLPNAIRVHREILEPMGEKLDGVRIDSGDITYLTKKVRKILDDAGLTDCKIVVSNSLDEYIIRDTLMQGAQIDSFGVGERLITSKSEPVFGGVYKLTAVWDGEEMQPKIKLSENVEKITLPGFKQVYRLYERDTDKAIADVITLHDEEIDTTQPYEIFDPEHAWKRKKISDFRAEKLLVKIFDKGKLVYTPPVLSSVKEYCASEIDKLWDEVKRFENPHKYYVDLSQPLWDMRASLLKKFS
ncbi:MAG: nicotinate phosphoribosyltransferase [Ruminococcaceae bacterium]|nr:nicotinate phosphoribosyltransferase [Oscillospiraceae bacterium]